MLTSAPLDGFQTTIGNVLSQIKISVRMQQFIQITTSLLVIHVKLDIQQELRALALLVEKMRNIQQVHASHAILRSIKIKMEIVNHAPQLSLDVIHVNTTPFMITCTVMIV